MKTNQLTRGSELRVMYVENKDGLIDGSPARIGWVRFSKTGRSVYYKGRTLKAIGGSGVRGNFMDEESGDEYWVSGVKKRGSNVHALETASVVVDDDATEEYQRIREDGEISA